MQFHDCIISLIGGEHDSTTMYLTLDITSICAVYQHDDTTIETGYFLVHFL